MSSVETRVFKMQVGVKRKKHEDSCRDEESSEDETWAPGDDTSSEEEIPEPTATTTVRTRSRGPAEPVTSADAVMDAADKDVDNESDLSSDTEEDSDEDEEESSGEEEEEEEESDEESEYSDDDSFVTSNEDADLEEREEIMRSYSKVFDEQGYEEEDEEEQINVIGDSGTESLLVARPPEEDLSVGGYVAGTGEM